MSEEIQNPFPNEHAARVASPDNFTRIVQLQKLPNGIRILGGPLKSDPEGSGKPQSYRFPRTKFTPSEAKAWLSEHNIKVQLFENATDEKKSLYENYAPQFIKNVSKDVAEINLFDEIGMGGISGQQFADEIQMLNDFGVKEIHININSPGGSIIEGFSIFSAIMNSEAEVHTHIVGIAASMAGVIAMAGVKITMVDFGKLMIHNPSGSKDPDEKEQNALDSLKDSLLVIFKNRTNKSKAELSDIMDSETWLNPKEALNGGFIDEIVSSKHKEKKKKRQPVAEIVNILNLNKPDKMKNLCKYLDLSEDATEQSILEAVKKINDELTEVKSTLETVEAKLTEADETITNQKTAIKSFEDKQAELNETLVDETIEGAIKDGKFDEKDKEELTEQFKNDLTGLKMIVGKLKTPAEIISDKLNPEGKTDIPEDRKDWSLRKMEEEDPALAEKIRNEKPELYAKMYKAEYKVELVTA